VHGTLLEKSLAKQKSKKAGLFEVVEAAGLHPMEGHLEINFRYLRQSLERLAWLQGK